MKPGEHDQRVDRLLRRVHTRFFRGGEVASNGEAVSWENPLDELCAREEEALREASLDAIDATQALIALEVLPDPLVALIREKVFDTFRDYEETFLGWLFDKSPHPLPVLRRLYIYARKKRASLLWNMSYRNLGELFDVSHETLRVETKKHFGYLPGGATKTATARASMRSSAKGNKCRRGGKKAGANDALCDGGGEKR